MSKVTVISPINANQCVEIASGERASIAYLLALVVREYRSPLVVIDGTQEVPADQFIALMHGTGQVSMKTTTRPTPQPHTYQLAATC